MIKMVFVFLLVFIMFMLAIQAYNLARPEDKISFYKTALKAAVAGIITSILFSLFVYLF